MSTHRINKIDRYKDMQGQRIGRLIVVSFTGHDKFNRAIWNCLCDCGNTAIVAGINLRDGYTKSCGCLFREINKGITVDNTGKATRLFSIWASMKDRCLNIKNIKYFRYGGRGISICNEWLVFENFYNWANNNGYQDNLTIDRIDGDGNYEQSNCRWSTRLVQAENITCSQGKSGVRGVTWHKATGKWYARIFSQKGIYQKLFDKFEDACIAVKSAREEIFNL